MWPFRRKREPPPEAGHEAGSTATAEPPPNGPAAPRTAADVLRQLEADAAAQPPPAQAPPPDPHIGRCLLAEGPVTREFLDKQLTVAGKRDSYLGRLLAETHTPGEATLLRVLAAGYQVPEVDLKQCRVHVPTARSIPREIAFKYGTVPIARIGEIVCVVFAGDPNPKAIEAIRRETGAAVKALRCPAHHVQILLRRLYARQAAPSASKALAAVPIAKHEHDEAARSPAARAEARWESCYASPGPVAAVRLARR